MTKLRVLVLCLQVTLIICGNYYGERYEGTKPLNPKKVLQNIFVRGCVGTDGKACGWESVGMQLKDVFLCVCTGRAGIEEEEEEDNSNHTPHL
jgi:hypothetical protein